MGRKNTSNKYTLLNKANLIRLIGIIIAYVCIYTVVSQDLLLRQYRSILVLTAVNIILAVSLNLVTGFLGELSLGHAGFMMVGAYASAIFTNAVLASNPDMSPFLLVVAAVLIGGTCAAISGVIIGIPVLRLQGDYLAIVTLAFGEIIRSVCENLKITNGAGGLSGIEKLTNYKHFTYAFVLMVISILIISNLIKSKHGRAILSVRDNHIAAQSMGIPLSRFKLLAFVLGAFFAGIAGVIHAHNQGSIFPMEAGYNKSIDILVIVVLGGMGSIKGSIIAAVILTVLPELLRDAADFRQLLYAVVLIVLMIANSSEKFVLFKNRLLSRFPKFKKLQKKGE